MPRKAIPYTLKRAIANQLDRLLTGNGVSRSQLATDLAMDTSAITKLTTAVNAPSIPTLIALADYFKTSTDYLLGRTDSTAPESVSPAPSGSGENLSAFIGKQVTLLMERDDVTQYRLAKDIKKGEMAIAFIRKGVNTPAIDTLLDLANYFKVSTDYLLGREEHATQLNKDNPQCPKNASYPPKV